jgi:flagellar basal-body rod modification protein FlgD
MATISTISDGAAAPLLPGDGTSAGFRVPQKILGQEEFMRLLAVQFQMQDPMKPMADTAFIAQSAQFAALEQSSGLVRQIAELRADQQRTAANSYLGLHVTFDAGNGDTASGIVSSLDLKDSEPRLSIDGRGFPLSAVLTAARPAFTGPVPPLVIDGTA